MKPKEDPDSKIESKKSFFKFDSISWIFIAISGLLLIFSFFAPILLNTTSKIGTFNCTSNELGDTLGGIMSPFIAIAGVLMTFLAFYIQYKANEAQKERLNSEVIKQEIEKNEQKLKYIKSEVENRFYEMLRIHRDNINEISIVSNSPADPSIFNTYKGREVFKFFIDEFDLYFYLADTLVAKGEYDKNINESFAVFYRGTYKEDIGTYSQILKILKSNEFNISEIRDIVNGSKAIENKLQYIQDIRNLILKQKCPICNGKYSILGTYFRHLLQILEYVVNQSESILSYEEKRNLIKILRSQLSTDEQLLLYLHWKSRFGYAWENEQNKFFTDYRLIYNIAQLETYFQIDLKELSIKPLKKEINNTSDPLFEFEEWFEANPDFK